MVAQAFRRDSSAFMGSGAVAIVGPTASGKTRLAVALARHINGEIISADSRQVYRGMSIGTGKDLDEYGEIPYHLIDICEPGTKYNLFRYLRDFREAYSHIISRGKSPVICGGTGMYVENALKGIELPEVPANPELRASLQGKELKELAEILAGYKTLHNSTDIDTAQRAIRAIEIERYYMEHPDEAARVTTAKATPLQCTVIGVEIPRDDRRRRISQRLDARLKGGMVDEIKGLLDSGIPAENLIYYGLEYKYVTLYVTGQISYDEMHSSLETAIHQFAKRQMTWFRGMEKRGTTIHWLPYDMPEADFLEACDKLMA